MIRARQVFPTGRTCGLGAESRITSGSGFSDSTFHFHWVLHRSKPKRRLSYQGANSDCGEWAPRDGRYGSRRAITSSSLLKSLIAVIGRACVRACVISIHAWVAAAAAAAARVTWHGLLWRHALSNQPLRRIAVVQLPLPHNLPSLHVRWRSVYVPQMSWSCKRWRLNSGP